MKSYKKRFSEILFNAFESNRKKKNVTNKGVNELIKNSEFYKQNIFSIRASIIFFFKTKYLLKKKISANYLDSMNNYNKMIINNILSNNISRIKEKYTEMLYNIESNDIVTKYIPKKDIYYFLKYLVVLYDKFYIQYPNYIRDFNVYFFMTKYLLKKQHNIDAIKEKNKNIYIEEKINKLFSKYPQREAKLLSSSLSSNDSEKNYSKLKQMRGQGFSIDMGNSLDSLYKLESLVNKVDKNLEIPNISNIYMIKRSKSFKNIDTFIINYPEMKKPKKVKWTELYEINSRKLMRDKKRKGTEFKLDRKRVSIEKVIEIDKVKKKIFKKKKTKKEIRQSIINKRNEIKEIRKILLEKDVAQNNKILDVVKRGFAFINENKPENSINKNLLINSYLKKDIKLYEDREKANNNNNNNNSNKEIEIKEKIIQLSKNKNFKCNNYYNSENYNLFKNRKYILKNLNDNLNEYRFYNKIKQNTLEKQKYYEKKINPRLFNIKIDSLLNIKNTNEINYKFNKTKILPFIDSITPKSNKENTFIQTICKKLSKVSNNNIDFKIRNNNLLGPFDLKNKSEYYIDSFLSNNEKRNSKIFNNKMERLENSIYKYYKTNIKEKGIPLIEYKLNYFNRVHLTDKNNSKNNIRNKNIRNNVVFSKANNNTFSKKKIGPRLKNKFNNEIILLENIKKSNDYNNLSIKDKVIKNIKDKINQNSIEQIESNDKYIKIRLSNSVRQRKKSIKNNIE